MGKKNNQAKQYAMNVAANAVIIFGSYILAVVIRYNLFQPDISIDALSTPFLIIAGTRWCQTGSGHGGIRW